MSKKLLFFTSIIFSLFLTSGCQLMRKKACCRKSSAVFGQADVMTVNEQKIEGQVFFQQVSKRKMKVTAQFKGLKTNQSFGFHVHEFGNCKNKALMAGGHLNPWNKKHGAPNDKEKHAGDLGNLSSDAKGQASYSAIVKGKIRRFFGRSVVVHALPDDLKSQPTGNSGERIACGVIVIAMPTVVAEPKAIQKMNMKMKELPKATQKMNIKMEELPKAIQKMNIKTKELAKTIQKMNRKIKETPKSIQKMNRKMKEAPKTTQKVDMKMKEPPKTIQKVNMKVKELPKATQKVNKEEVLKAKTKKILDDIKK